jgi:anti-sigma regulatory factor (Ser/Thr protein kinase)
MTHVAEQAVLQRSTRLEPVPASASVARRLVREALTEADATELAVPAQLAVSELVTNAILHAATLVDVTMEVTADSLTVRVRDWSPRLPEPRTADDLATGGRGLAIVAAVTDEHGVDLRPVGKSVWFRLLRGDRAAAGPHGS